MATVAESILHDGSFPLGDALAGAPDVTIELERLVPTNSAISPYFWVRGSDRTADLIGAAFESHLAVDGVELVDIADGDCLFRVEWNPGARGVIGATAGTDVSLVSGVGSADVWTFQVRGDEQGACPSSGTTAANSTRRR